MMAAAIILLIAIAAALFVRKRLRDCKTFQQSASMGTVCSFYTGEVKSNATVVAVFADQLIVEDTDGIPHHVHRNDIYPPKRFMP